MDPGEQQRAEGRGLGPGPLEEAPQKPGAENAPGARVCLPSRCRANSGLLRIHHASLAAAAGCVCVLCVCGRNMETRVVDEDVVAFPRSLLMM